MSSHIAMVIGTVFPQARCVFPRRSNRVAARVTVAKISRFAALLLSALTSGVFFGTRASLGPSSKQFRPSTYVEVQQATIRNPAAVLGDPPRSQR
ncbi:MAG: hypothetical protein QOI16_2584 [Pseudonocardiales bacterium]|nr:hypothetical protein [Pseudonocardiales bacterium]